MSIAFGENTAGGGGGGGEEARDALVRELVVTDGDVVAVAVEWPLSEARQTSAMTPASTITKRVAGRISNRVVGSPLAAQHGKNPHDVAGGSSVGGHRGVSPLPLRALPGYRAAASGVMRRRRQRGPLSLQ